jgi:hypothetical protein
MIIVGLACTAAPATASALPSILVECNGSSTCEGPDVWFTAPVFVDWTVTGGTPTAGCQDITIDQDTKGNPQGCSATGSGTSGATVVIKLDQTPPVVMDALPDRPPDYAGWYTRPVAFSITGKDATSGLDSCASVTYAGPDGAAATILATCRDQVGHVASRAFPLRYDATPPDASGATAKPGDRVVRLRWPAVTTASVVRTPGLGGRPTTELTPEPGGITDLRVRNRIAYRYVVTLTDQAGNAARRELVVVPGPRLLAPAKRALVSAPPLLRWTPVRRARYYNVQLFRNGRKVLSAWPKRPQLHLRARWRFNGRRYRLVDGRYRWYVWPGEGPRSARRYGDRIGARSFVLDRR